HCIEACVRLAHIMESNNLRSSKKVFEIMMYNPEITDSLLIRGSGDLLLLIKGALHLLSRLGLFKCRAGGGGLFACYFLLLITCAPQNPRPSLACAICFGYGCL